MNGDSGDEAEHPYNNPYNISVADIIGDLTRRSSGEEPDPVKLKELENERLWDLVVLTARGS